MICSSCGGLVIWMGPFSSLTHTQCQQCGATNNQIVEPEFDDGPEFGDGHDCEGFVGGCERFGCEWGDACTELAKNKEQP